MQNLDDLKVFLLVAQTGSFTKASARLGVSQSALSYTVKMLEERLKIKLLERTTRSVSTTQAGEQLRLELEPLFAQIDESLTKLSADQGKLSGKLRLTGNEHAFNVVLKQKLVQFALDYPDVELELVAENRFSDIISERFDAGVRVGSDVAKEMIATRISPDWQMCAVASPSYLAHFGTPSTPFELADHQCLALRLPTLENALAWQFVDPKQGKTLNVQPNRQFVTNSHSLLIEAAKQGKGIAWLPKDMLENELQSGELVEILADWAMSYAGYYLYYPSRKSGSPLFAALVEGLKG